MFFQLILCIWLVNLGRTYPRIGDGSPSDDLESLADLVNPSCADKPGLNCEDIDKQGSLCLGHPDQARVFCPAFCGLCSSVTTMATTKTPLQLFTTSGKSSVTTPETSVMVHGTTFGVQQSTQNQAETSTEGISPSTKKIILTTEKRQTTRVHTIVSKIHTSSQPFTTTTGYKDTPLTTYKVHSSSKLLETTAGHIGTTTANTEYLILLSFQNMDKDKDGLVSLFEFEMNWEKMDINGDGIVSETEFSTSTHFSKYITAGLFAFIDHDHNHMITLQEVPRIYSEFDTDYSGSIEKEEYIKEYQRIYQVL